MFLDKRYILANELVQKMAVNIANISIIKKQLDNDNDLTTIVKLNNCNFINTKSQKLPNNIQIAISKNEFTDISNKLPVTYIRTEYSMTEKELLKSKMISGKTNIAGKDFYIFNDGVVSSLKNKIGYVLNKKDMQDCYKKGLIEGFIQLNSNKFFTWYSVGAVIGKEYKDDYSLGNYND